MPLLKRPFARPRRDETVFFLFIFTKEFFEAADERRVGLSGKDAWPGVFFDRESERFAPCNNQNTGIIIRFLGLNPMPLWSTCVRPIDF